MHHALKTLTLVLALVVVLGLPLSGFAAEKIDINTATITQLQIIKGVGPKTADKIVAYREQHGQFKTVTQLCEIKGIGEKSLQKMVEQICVK
ncbi:MAG: helix-hairpin-helix domain-containing protein [Thermodesulfobacteriota bacterium]|nr:helix-hairpin-helix domain-containing protein [Thermodesulfobacteriota bacterium]